MELTERPSGTFIVAFATTVGSTVNPAMVSRLLMYATRTTRTTAARAGHAQPHLRHVPGRIGEPQAGRSVLRVLQRIARQGLRPALQADFTFQFEPRRADCAGVREAEVVDVDDMEVDELRCLVSVVEIAVRTRSPKYASHTHSCVSMDSGLQIRGRIASMSNSYAFGARNAARHRYLSE